MADISLAILNAQMLDDPNLKHGSNTRILFSDKKVIQFIFSSDFNRLTVITESDYGQYTELTIARKDIRYINYDDIKSAIEIGFGSSSVTFSF